MPRRRAAWGAAVAAVIALALSGSARAEGLGATLEPEYAHVESDTTDQGGRTTHTMADALAQRYRLTFDRALTAFLTASAGATWLDQQAWTRTDGIWSDGHARETALFGRLSLGTPVLSATVGVDRREQRTLTPSSPGLVVESLSASAGWRPRDLPELEAQASRVSTFDTTRQLEDVTNDSASFGARYATRAYELRYHLAWTRVDDHLARTLTTALEQTVLASRSDTLFDGRTMTHVSGTFQTRTSSAEAEGEGGTVTRQQLPVTGFSGIEAPPATAVSIELAPNPGVVDGDTRAGTGVNVGFGPSAANDTDPRDVGAGFADEVTPVSRIDIVFDRALSDAVTDRLVSTLAVYESKDNQSWEAVSVIGRPVPSPLERRIEITIVQRQARFLKVVLIPLPVGLTTDPAFRDLFVTELQFQLVLPVSSVPTRQSSRAAAVRGSARTILLRDPQLTYDVSATFTYQSEGAETYSVVNGLSLGRNLTRTIAVDSRVARLDQDLGRGHEGSWRWNASLVGSPFPTARWNLTYSGRATDEGDIANALSALARADLYEGISAQANGTVSRASTHIENLALGTSEEQTTTAADASGRISLTPNPWVSVSGGGQYSRSLASSITRGDVLTQFARIDGTLTLTPAPALSATGTLARILLGARPTTLGTLQVNYFPLRGDLQLSFVYSRTLDTAAEATTAVFTPSLRWNIRPNASLQASYSFVDRTAPVQAFHARAFDASLLISL